MNTPDRPDVPDLVNLYLRGELPALASALLSYPETAEAVSQALWMAANLMDAGQVTADGLRNLAIALCDEDGPRRPCRYCRGDETATACDCV